jgi:hypothetical protein
MYEANPCASQPTNREVGDSAAMAAQAGQQPVTAASVNRAPTQPRLTAWDYVQIDRLMRARRRAARR